MDLVDRFQAARPRLLSLAHRLVGSRHDAEDAVQNAWLRAQSADLSEVDNLDGWLTTVTARLCLDLLRARERRGELPLLSDQVPSEQLSADETFLRREDVSRAVLVLLDELSPRQRVAYVLHDLFAVPFDQVAAVLAASPDSAKKLASRARARVRKAQPPDTAAYQTAGAEHLATVEAFLAAARGGDMARLIAMMAPDAVRIADLRLLPPGVPERVHGAQAVAEETTFFLDRIAVTAPLLIDGQPGAVIAPGGHAFALLRFRIDDGRVTEIAIAPYRPGAL